MKTKVRTPRTADLILLMKEIAPQFPFSDKPGRIVDEMAQLAMIAKYIDFIQRLQRELQSRPNTPIAEFCNNNGVSARYQALMLRHGFTFKLFHGAHIPGPNKVNVRTVSNMIKDFNNMCGGGKRIRRKADIE